MSGGGGRTTVLHLIYGLKFGGAERVIAPLCTGIDRGRYIPVVGLLTCGGPFEADLKAGGVEVVRFNKSHVLDFAVVPRIARFIREREVGVVHTHLFSANMWGRLAARLAGRPVVVVHEQSVDPWKSAVHFAIDRFLLRWTDAVIPVSNAVKVYYQEKLRRGNGIFEVVYNGVNYGRFASATADGKKRELLGIPRSHRVLGAIGRLVPQKGLDVLLAAFAAVSRSFGEASCVILGEGPLKEEMEKRVEQLGLSGKVFFVGPRLDIQDWLAEFDIVVTASRYEGLSLALAEAMAAGKPVVATAVGGNAELVVDGETGFIVPPEDAGALSAAILNLLGDPGMIASMGERGRRRVRDGFTEERMARKVQAVYDRLLAARRA